MRIFQQMNTNIWSKSRKMLFNNEKEVNSFIRDNGFFVNESTDALYVKCSDYDFKQVNEISINRTIVNAKDRLFSFIEYNTYPFINFDGIKLPQINIDVFKKYDDRNKKINEHKKLQQEFNDSQSILKKSFKLVHFDRINHNNTSHYFIFNTKTENLSEYDEKLLEDADYQKCNYYSNQLQFNNAIFDDLVNEYSEEYETEKAKFNELKINPNGI